MAYSEGNTARHALTNDFWGGEVASKMINHHIYVIVNVGSDNGVAQPGYKLLPEPMLTQIYITIWYH